MVSSDCTISGRHNRTASLSQIVTAICLLIVCMMAAAILTVSILALTRSIRGEGTSDFVEYWAAGQLLTHGGNPYEAEAAFQLEREVGRGTEVPEVIFSPPPILVLVAPLGLVGGRVGAVLWMVLLIACLAISIRLLWILHGRRSGGVHLLCYCYAPALACLMSGQIGVVLLFGVVLFFYLYEPWPALSGAALAVCIVKPHLFLPFGLVLLVWALHNKRYRILAGISIGLFAACALPVCLDPHVWTQYARVVSAAKPAELPVPTLSRMFRLLIDRDAAWVQFVPEFANCCWALWYFWSRRDRWNWLEHGSLLLLVSVACAPYAWFTDEVILIPAIMLGLYRSVESRRSLLLFGLIAGVELTELLKGLWITTPYFIWSIPAWFAWYVYASRRSGEERLSVQ